MQGIFRVFGMSDIAVFFYVNQRLHCRMLDRLMPLCTLLGGAAFTVTSSFLLILIGKGYLKITAIYGFMALACSFVIGYLLKKMFGRARPYQVLPDTYTGSKLFIDYSFPSGHTAAAFSLAVNYAYAYPALGISLMVLAVLVGLSRIYLGQHYPTDVLAGATLGTLTNIFLQMIL